MLNDESDLVRLEACWKIGAVAKRMVEQQEQPLEDGGIINLQSLHRSSGAEELKNRLLAALDAVRRADPNSTIRERAAEKLDEIDGLRADLKKKAQTSGNVVRPPVRASDLNR